jgi:hypothetical protein
MIESTEPYPPPNEDRPVFFIISGITQKEVKNHLKELQNGLENSPGNTGIVLPEELTEGHFLYILLAVRNISLIPPELYSDGPEHDGVHFIYLDDSNDNNPPAFYWGNWAYRHSFIEECSLNVSFYNDALSKIEGIKLQPVTSESDINEVQEQVVPLLQTKKWNDYKRSEYLKLVEQHNKKFNVAQTPMRRDNSKTKTFKPSTTNTKNDKTTDTPPQQHSDQQQQQSDVASHVSRRSESHSDDGSQPQSDESLSKSDPQQQQSDNETKSGSKSGKNRSHSVKDKNSKTKNSASSPSKSKSSKERAHSASPKSNNSGADEPPKKRRKTGSKLSVVTRRGAKALQESLTH